MTLSKARLEARKKRLEKKFKPDFHLSEWRKNGKKKEPEEYSERPEWDWLKK